MTPPLTLIFELPIDSDEDENISLIFISEMNIELRNYKTDLRQIKKNITYYYQLLLYTDKIDCHVEGIC
jgi:hypothetical protein